MAATTKLQTFPDDLLCVARGSTLWFSDPNAVAFRPYDELAYQQIKSLPGDNNFVYVVAAGVVVPEGLELIQLGPDEFDLLVVGHANETERQTKIDNFLKTSARLYPADRWLRVEPSKKRVMWILKKKDKHIYFDGRGWKSQSR